MVHSAGQPEGKNLFDPMLLQAFLLETIGIEGDNGCIVDIWLSVDGYLRHGLQHGKQFFTAGGFMSKNSIDCFLPYKGNAGTQRQNTSNVQCTTFQAIRQKIWHFQFGRKTPVPPYSSGLMGNLVSVNNRPVPVAPYSPL